MRKKVVLSYKQVGRNLNVNINGEVRTKTGTREELAPLKEALKAYDEKPLQKHLKAITDLLKPVSVAKEKKKEMVKAEIKRVKRVGSRKESVKKEEDIVSLLEKKIKSGELNASQIEKLKGLVVSEKEKQKLQPSAREGKGYRAEY